MPTYQCSCGADLVTIVCGGITWLVCEEHCDRPCHHARDTGTHCKACFKYFHVGVS